MKLIVIANHKDLQLRPDKNMHNFFSYIKKYTKHSIDFYEAKDQQQIKAISNSDENVIIIVFSSLPADIHNINHKKIFWMEDVCCMCKYKCDGTPKNCRFREQYKYVLENKFDICWYKYETFITQKLKQDYPNKYYKFPHMFFDLNIHKDYGLEKKNDILFYGALNPAYPFRRRLYNLLQTKKYNTTFLPYSKRRQYKMKIGEDLCKSINESWLTIATKSINSLLLAKYYEIALSGSVVCGDYPELEDETFLKQNMIYIDNNMTDDEILTIIDNALQNKDLLRNYSQNTIQYFSNRYTLQQGLEHFEKLLD